MNWLLRFTLGLPARPVDANEVRELLPELQNKNWRPTRRYLAVWLTGDIYSSDQFVDALHRWIAAIEDSPPQPSSHERCPSQNCPLKLDEQRASGVDGEEDVQLYLRYQVVAGGPNARAPRESFFDLVRKVHPKADSPREVILTDPYIYTDVSEDGRPGGLNNLVDYLTNLGIDQLDNFTLTITPSPKRGGKTAKHNLQRLLKRRFLGIKFKDFSPTLAFHDRLYIVRHKSGAMRGLFGPSLNGLSSQSIVLMGELTDPQPMQRIKSWLG
jgi:hypothetical protein